MILLTPVNQSFNDLFVVRRYILFIRSLIYLENYFITLLCSFNIQFVSSVS